MKWAYDLTGAEPIIKDMPIYDGTAISAGELLMLGTTAFSAAADAGIALVSAYPTTVMADVAIDAVGISLEGKTTSDTPSIAAAHNLTTGAVCFGKVIINPFAVYRAEVVAADALSIASSASTGAFCVTGVPASVMNGSWVYFSASAGPNFGNIRRIITSATGGSMVMDASVSATITTADKVILISERNKYPHMVSADALTMGQTTVGGNGATNIRVVENLIDRGNGLELLRAKTHSQIKLDSTQAKKTKFYQEIVLKDHAFGLQE
jgi:hypothetical protein